MRVKTVAYALLQILWGLPQTAVGFVLFLCHLQQPHAWYHGVLVTDWQRFGGVSLGLFVFAGTNAEALKAVHLPQTGQVTPADCRALLVHEYGHTVQSAVLGPLYLPVVGLPSLLWSRHPRCRALRQRRHLPYAAFYTERWANRWGEAVTREPSLRDMHLD